MGGNLINNQGNCKTPTVDLLTVKLLLNSIISTPNAYFMTINLKGFYLMTPKKRYKYFRMKLEIFPKTSSTYTTFRTKWITMKMSTVKSAVECTVFPRQASLPRNSLSNIYSKQDTTKAKTCQDIGNTSEDPSVSLW